METSKGTLLLALDEVRAPATTANFLDYARKGHFDGLIFHRVIPGFVIQGGGFLPDMYPRKAGPPIQFERTGLRNLRYTLSMARTSDPHSATSQFFINLVDNPGLDRPASGGPGYAVFGEVTAGREIVDAIARVSTRTLGPYRDVPVSPVRIDKVQVLEPGAAE